MSAVDPGPTGASAVEALLSEAGIAHQVVDHAATFRASDEAEAAGVPPGHVAKTVVLVDGEVIWLAVVPASRRLDLDRMRDAVGAGRRLRLATEDEVAEAFPGFEVGAIPPLGRLLGVGQVVDDLVVEHREVLAAAGDHVHGVLVDPVALVEAVGAVVADISEHRGEGRRHRFSDAPPL